MTELSGQERGYVPPDHTSTSEFAIPQPADDVPGGGPGTAQGGPGDLAEATLVDRPIVPARGGPADTVVEASGPSSTVTDVASAPSTVTDETFVDPPPEPEPEPEPVEDTAVDSEDGAEGAPVKGALPLPPLDLEEQASRLRTPASAGSSEPDDISESPEWPEVPGASERSEPEPEPETKPDGEPGSGPEGEGGDAPQSVVVAAAAPPKEPPKVVTFKASEQGEWTQRFGAEEDGDIPVAGPRKEAPPAGGEPVRPGEWTERFGAEEAEGAPAVAFRKEAPPAAGKPAGSEAPAPSASPGPSVPSASPSPSVPSASAESPASQAQGQARSPSVGLPPGTPVGPAAPAPAGRPSQDRPRRPAFLAAVIGAVLIIGVGAIFAALMAGRGGAGGEPAARPASPGNPAATASAAPPSPGTTANPEAEPTAGAPESPPQSQAPGQAPGESPGQGPGGTTPDQGAQPVEPVRQGDGVTYRLVQRDPGYYEGRFVITNRTGRPLTGWTITFQVPGGNVKNVWGGQLVRGGSSVEISNLPNARPIPPGATWEVQFGAEGAATDPRLCRVNGRPCGF